MNRKQHLLFGAALAVAALVVACAGGAMESGDSSGDVASSTMLSMDPSAGVPTIATARRCSQTIRCQPLRYP